MDWMNKVRLAAFNIRLAVILILVVVLGVMVIYNYTSGLSLIDNIIDKSVELVKSGDVSDVVIETQFVELRTEMQNKLYTDIIIQTVIIILLIFEVAYTIKGRSNKG